MEKNQQIFLTFLQDLPYLLYLIVSIFWCWYSNANLIKFMAIVIHVIDVAHGPLVILRKFLLKKVWLIRTVDKSRSGHTFDWCRYRRFFDRKYLFKWIKLNDKSIILKQFQMLLFSLIFEEGFCIFPLFCSSNCLIKIINLNYRIPIVLFLGGWGYSSIQVTFFGSFLGIT